VVVDPSQVGVVALLAVSELADVHPDADLLLDTPPL
jgi:hypothetical protein